VELDIIASCQKWAKEYVLALDLCPFASEPINQDLITWHIVEDLNNIDQALEKFFRGGKSTTFFILREAQNFDYFLDILALTNQLIEALDYAEELTLVSFHPLHQYEGSEASDTVNYANRAPYPMVQVLRNQELEDLGMNDEWRRKILDRNEEVLSKIGSDTLNKMLDGYRGKN